MAKHCDLCDCDLPDCDACDCDLCNCDLTMLGFLRLSTLLLAVAAVAPRRSGGGGGRGAGRRVGGRVAAVADRAGLAAIAGYQRWLSPRLRTSCRYSPSCSHYGATAIDRHGLHDGLALTAARLRRCKVCVPAGTPDPVP